MYAQSPPVNRSLPRLLRAVGLVLLVVLLAPEAQSDDSKPRPRPAVHRQGPLPETDGKRKAPKSLSYIYGEESKEQDSADGGDDGENTGGDGTGDSAETGGPDFGGIRGFDLTDRDEIAGPSDFNASNLEDPELQGKRAPGNVALCFCTDDPGAPGFATAPGYGNDWDLRMRLVRPAPNPAQPTNVRLRFVFNHDVEPGRDFFVFEVNRNGTWEEEARFTGTNKNEAGIFNIPVVFDQTVALQPVDYTGPGQDQIQLRLRVLTDPHGSDEDGFFPSSGAAQVDEIRVWFDNVLVSYAPWDVAPFDGGWTPEAAPFVGDFLKLHRLVADLDPCRQNVTYQFSFVDDGTAPANAPGQTTGGETSPNWTYGPGGFVVNYSGGVSGEDRGLHNELRTPAFAWDIPGVEDDPKYGAILFFSVWKHLPLENGLFYTWRVRAYSTGSWGPWRDHGFQYYEPSLPHYERVEVDVTTLMPAQPESVQVALGVVDLAAELSLPGQDATPSPMFDNILFAKYPKDGPAILLRAIDRFQDGFPTSGSNNWTQGSEMAIRLDAARDINLAGTANVPGDSIVADIRPVLPGTSLQGAPVLKVALLRNPRYNSSRVVPGAMVPVNGLYGTCDGPTNVTLRVGGIAGTQASTFGGTPISNRWAFDLPDGPPLPAATHQGFTNPLFFPGDQLHWFVEARDTFGNVVTDPPDTTGFLDFTGCSAYPRSHTVRGLPSVIGLNLGDPIEQPEVLVIDDTGRPDRQEVIGVAMNQLGMLPGLGYDLYAVQAAGSGVGNGIGSAQAHGANADQMGAYRTILYFAGDQGEFLLNNGTGSGTNDKGDDLGTILSWRAQNGPRNVVHFGDNLVSGLYGQSAGGAFYAQSLMAAGLVGPDVRDFIDGQLSPRVVPTGDGPPGFGVEFHVGACLGTDQFDALKPNPIGAVFRTHEFLAPNGQAGQYTVAAGLWHNRNTGNGERNDVTFPFAFSAILDPVAKVTGGMSARAVLLEEVLDALGEPLYLEQPTAGPVRPQPARLLPNHPNPFNPATQVAFELPQPGRVVLRIYDAQGRRVVTLLDEERPAGAQSVVWRGQDERGVPVASGVYLLEMRSGSQRLQRKMALVR